MRVPLDNKALGQIIEMAFPLVERGRVARALVSPHMEFRSIVDIGASTLINDNNVVYLIGPDDDVNYWLGFVDEPRPKNHD